MRKLIITSVLAAAIMGTLNTPAHALSISADSTGFNGGYYTWDINIHDLVLSSSNPISAYDLDLSFSSGFNKIVFTGALGELAPVTLTSTGSYDGTYTLSTLDLTTPFLIDFKEQTYYGPGDELTLYNHQNSLLSGSTLTLATVYFTVDQIPQLTNWYTGNGAPPYNNEVKLFDNEPLYPPVPEPATMLLLGSGLAALVPLRRRFRQRS